MNSFGRVLILYLRCVPQISIRGSSSDLITVSDLVGNFKKNIYQLCKLVALLDGATPTPVINVVCLLTFA